MSPNADAAADSVVKYFVARTPKSAALMRESSGVVAGGVSRNFGFHIPYPVVNERGEGPFLFDVDGNRYIDFAYNGLSLIHGHAYKPVTAEIARVLDRGWAWPGSSQAQIDYAAYLIARLPGMDRVRFTNSGTEAAMLAVKLARRVMRRPLILKAKAAYHGTFPDLEAGLHGAGAIPGSTLICDFGDTDQFVDTMSRHKDELAAIIIEPVLLTGAVVSPPDGFLTAICDHARRRGILIVLDDCLMLRLALAGSSEYFGIAPDIIVLGKFMGGGVPMGAVCGTDSVMKVFDADSPDRLYHGGSFNGNVMACRAGLVTMQDLTAGRIARMNAQGDRLREFLGEQLQLRQLRGTISGVGSVVGISFQDVAGTKKDYYTEIDTGLRFHLACLNAGLQLGAGGFLSLATVFDDALIDDVETRLADAFDHLTGAA